MENQSAFLSLLLITMLAALVPALAARVRRFKLPIIIGEILAGILIGKSGLNIVQPGPILEFLAEFGFVFLMFISGLEVNIGSLRLSGLSKEKRYFWREPLFLAILSFGLTLVAALGVATWLAKIHLVSNRIVMALILSTTSMGIVVPVLKERKITGISYGQVILVTALLADVLTLVFLSVAFGIVRKGFALQLILLLLLLAIFALALRMGILASKRPAIRKLVRELSTATAQIQVRGAIALMVAWAALAHALGTEVVLGAFLAGVIVGIIAGPEEVVLRENLDVLGFGFFIPIFFISVGVRFDLTALFGSINAVALLPLLICAAYAVKVIPALSYRLAFSWQESFSAGFLLSSRLSLIIAASTVALSLNMINEAVNAAIILVAMITCTLSPLVFNRLTPSTTALERKGTIIIGFNQLTGLLAERLLQEGEEVSMLGCPEDYAEASYCRGVVPQFDDPASEKVLEKLGAESAAALIVAVNEPEKGIAVCKIAIERFGIPVVISRADDHDSMEAMKALGVRVIQPAMATAIALEGALRFPAAFDMLADRGKGVELEDARLRNARFDGRALRDIRLPGNALVMGIRRKGEVIVPHGDTVFRTGDEIMLVGSSASVKEAKAVLETP